MKTRFFLSLFAALTFASAAFSQTNANAKRPQAYLFSGGASKTSTATPAKKSYLLSGGEARVNLSRPRVFRSETMETVKASKPTNTAYSLERKAFDLINQQRAQMNLPSLKWSDDAAKIARMHSQNMANQRFFSHTGSDGSSVNDRADSAGVKKWRAIGENIAYNQGFENPVEFAVERWMLSPKHRDNLLNSRWQESGIGIAIAENGTYYFTEVFLASK